MRKAVWSVALVLLFGLPAHAQGVSGGVKAGLNFANIKFDPEPEEDYKARNGLIAGGFVTLPIGSAFAIQPEALYVQKGAKLEVAEDITSSFEFAYLEFPILARIGTDSFNVFVGPSFGVKLSAEVETEAGGSGVRDDISDEIKGTDIGLVVGVGFGGSRFVFDARITWGRTDINDNPDETVEARNQSLAVMFGIKIG